MISQIKQKGFTIVELLIVIVVIAILAALSYVGYTSITARANTSTAAASAKAVKDTAQVFHGSHGVWPANKAAMVSGYPSGGSAADAVAKLPSDVVFIVNSGTNQYGASDSTASAAVRANTASNAAKTVTVYPCGSTGMRVFYRDFANSSTVKYMDAGDCSTAPVSATAAFTNS